MSDVSTFNDHELFTVRVVLSEPRLLGINRRRGSGKPQTFGGAAAAVLAEVEP